MVYCRADIANSPARGGTLQHDAGLNSMYRVRIPVIGPEHTPVESASVWTSIGGEPKRVNGGWEFDIPSGNKPPHGGIIIYAKIPNSSLLGNANLRLGTDRNPSIAVALEADESAMIRGTVEDDSGHTLGGVDVSVVGYHPAAVSCRIGQPATCHTAFALNERAQPPCLYCVEAALGFTGVTAR